MRRLRVLWWRLFRPKMYAEYRWQVQKRTFDLMAELQARTRSMFAQGELHEHESLFFGTDDYVSHDHDDYGPHAHLHIVRVISDAINGELRK